MDVPASSDLSPLLRDGGASWPLIAMPRTVSGLRSDPEYSYQFTSVRGAANVWAMPPIRVRDGCHILARKQGEAEYKTLV